MDTRRWFIVSVLLALLALVLQITGLGYYGKSSRARAGLIRQSVEQRPVSEVVAKKYLRTGVFVISVGQLCAIASVVMLGISLYRREPGEKGYAIVLLVMYLMAWFLLV